MGLDPQEAVDREHLEDAIAAIRQRDFASARLLLQAIVANCPEPYIYRFVDGDEEYIRFWDNDEFLAYVLDYKKGAADGQVLRQIVWLSSVYPRAYFYLAYADIEEGRYSEARAHLEQVLRLEPDQPQALCEFAALEIAEGRREQAIDLYRRALAARPSTPAHDRALALRGLAVQLIDLGQLDEAEQHLRASLVLDPRNPKTAQELEYIRRLRTGKLPERVRLVSSEPGPLRCEICGTEEPYEGAKVFKVNGRAVFVCEDCYKRSRRRWWEFWKR
jgi:tetratricopeptide (TPR) repeat protein